MHARLQDGGGSFEEFYKAEYRAVLAYARALTGDFATAEDIAQDAFTAAMTRWNTIDNPPHWIRRVTANKAKSGWRRRQAGRAAQTRLEALIMIETSLEPDTTGFWEEVRRLPHRQAQAIVLHYMEDRPTAEIAAILGCAESTARVHLMKGRRTLAGRLELEE